MKIEIKHRFSGAVLFSHEQENNFIKITLEFAVNFGADLRGADLRGAYLGGADLGGACLGGADLGGADLGGAYLRGADLGGAYLGGACLRGSDLSGADLGGADLGGADLGGAYLRGATYGRATLEKGIIQLLGKLWPVYIFDAHIKIGYQMHSIEEWESFSDDQILKMSNKAIDFWKENKEVIITLAKHHQNK